MTARTREETVTFRHPFTLASLERFQPAGTYRIVIDEEEIHGLSFLAYLRTATILHIPAISDTDALHQLYMVDSAELAAALEADERALA